MTDIEKCEICGNPLSPDGNGVTCLACGNWKPHLEDFSPSQTKADHGQECLYHGL